MGELDNLRTRVKWVGKTRDGRLSNDKLRSLKAALKDSYQGEWITLNKKIYRCLINQQKLTEDYDQKTISIEFDSGIKEGDTFYWNRTKTHWLVYLQQLTEEAYFRAQIRKCDYKIDVNGNEYWVYIRGPVETETVWNQKHSISFNDLNYSLVMYITKNDETKEFFSRFKKIKFDGHNWKVAATDKYSQPGIIQIYLDEDFDNTMEDEMIVPEIVTPDVDEPYIDGPQIVNPYDCSLVYSIKNINNGAFVVSSNKVKITNSNSQSCTLDIITGKSGSFEIRYEKENEDAVTLNVIIQSL